MALINCPECGKQISDKAKFCPHCGFVPNVNLDDFEIEDGVLVEYKGSGGDVTIPNGITAIDVSAFADCTELKSITIPDSVTSIYYDAFFGCTGLTSIKIPDSVTDIGEDAFANTAWYNNQPNGLVYAGKVAYKYKGICPSSITIKEGTLGIAYSAFSDCTELKSIVIPDSVTDIGEDAFARCTKLTNIFVESANQCYISEYGVLFNKNKTELICCSGGKTGDYIIPDSVTEIGDYAFFGCMNLTNITIPDVVTEIGDYAFFCCMSLTSIIIPDGVTEIGESVFLGCKSLKSISIPDSIIHIGIRAFYGCNELRSITIPDSVTSIGEDAFSDCKNITIICNPGSHAEEYAKECGITYNYSENNSHAKSNNPVEQHNEPVIKSNPEPEECPDFYEEEIDSDDYYEYYDYTWFEPSERINISEWWHLYYDDDADFVNKYDDWTMDPQ